MEEWTPMHKPQSMNSLSRHQISTIAKTRTRMLDIKLNFPNKHQNDTCRKCNTQPETQEHVLEQCQSIHHNNSTKVTIEQIFSDDIQKLRQTIRQIDKAMQNLHT